MSSEIMNGVDTTQEENIVSSVANQVANEQEAVSGSLKVYRKKSTFKGATEKDFFYSATRSDGDSVRVVFGKITPPDLSAFEIYDFYGNAKCVDKTSTTQSGEVKVYHNWTYYITSCKFREIQGEKLPF